jgi:hypothetical protein
MKTVIARADGNVVNSIANNEALLNNFISQLCKEAFEKAVKQIDLGKEMFDVKYVKDFKRNTTNVIVTCMFSVDNVKKE